MGIDCLRLSKSFTAPDLSGQNSFKYLYPVQSISLPEPQPSVRITLNTVVWGYIELENSGKRETLWSS